MSCETCRVVAAILDSEHDHSSPDLTYDDGTWILEWSGHGYITAVVTPKGSLHWAATIGDYRRMGNHIDGLHAAIEEYDKS